MLLETWASEVNLRGQQGQAILAEGYRAMVILSDRTLPSMRSHNVAFT